MQGWPICDTCTRRSGQNACFGRDWPFLPRYRPSPQLWVHSGQSKATTVRGITCSNRFNCKVSPSVILALDDVAKMRVLGYIGRFCHCNTHRHNCRRIWANPRQPQSGVLYFAIGLIAKLAHPRHFVLEDVAKSAFWGRIGCFLLSLCSDSAQGPLLPCDARLPIMYIYFPK